MLGGLCQWTRCSKLSDQGPPNPDINRLLSSPRQSYQISENGKVTVDRNGELIKVASIPNDHGYSMISMMPEKRRYPQMRECPHFGYPHVHYPVPCDVFFFASIGTWNVKTFGGCPISSETWKQTSMRKKSAPEDLWRFVVCWSIYLPVTQWCWNTHTHIYISYILYQTDRERYIADITTIHKVMDAWDGDEVHRVPSPSGWGPQQSQLEFSGGFTWILQSGVKFVPQKAHPKTDRPLLGWNLIPKRRV